MSTPITIKETTMEKEIIKTFNAKFPNVFIRRSGKYMYAFTTYKVFYTNFTGTQWYYVGECFSKGSAEYLEECLYRTLMTGCMKGFDVKIEKGEKIMGLLALNDLVGEDSCI